MKVKSFLLGTMIALAFTACSNDDDPIDNGGSASADGTTLEVSANIVNTKALGSTYTVYVFNDKGAYEAKGVVESKIEVTAGQKTFVVINEADLTPTTINDLASAINYSDAESTTPSTNSCVYNANCKRGQLNMVGFTADQINTAKGVNGATDATPVLLASSKIPVYRNVANIILSSVVVTTKTDNSATVVYTDPSISVDKVFILNAHNQALRTSSAVNAWWPTTEVVASADADANFVNGATAEQFATWWTAAQNVAKRYIATGQKAPAESAKLSILYTDAKASVNSPWSPSSSFFVYENTSDPATAATYNPTLLVLHGSFSYTANGQTVTESDRYWTIQIAKDHKAISADSWKNLAEFNLTVDKANALIGIRRNIQYTIDLTITGPGSDNPLYPGDVLKTYIDASVELVPWGTVSQSGNID